MSDLPQRKKGKIKFILFLRIHFCFQNIFLSLVYSSSSLPPYSSSFPFLQYLFCIIIWVCHFCSHGYFFNTSFEMMKRTPKMIMMTMRRRRLSTTTTNPTDWLSPLVCDGASGAVDFLEVQRMCRGELGARLERPERSQQCPPTPHPSPTHPSCTGYWHSMKIQAGMPAMCHSNKDSFIPGEKLSDQPVRGSWAYEANFSFSLIFFFLFSFLTDLISVPLSLHTHPLPTKFFPTSDFFF